jgi:hypothetical protein
LTASNFEGWIIVSTFVIAPRLDSLLLRSWLSQFRGHPESRACFRPEVELYYQHPA